MSWIRSWPLDWELEIVLMVTEFDRVHPTGVQDEGVPSILELLPYCR